MQTEMTAIYTDMINVIGMSLIVSLTSTAIAAFIGVAIGIPLALIRFKSKKALIKMTSTLMSMPPVLMGLLVYLALSRKGPFGSLQLLFTPYAMIIAQTLLVFPIIFGLTMSVISKSGREIEKTCIAIGADRKDTIITIIFENRIELLSIVATGFGRAISEVGAVMIVGGNIQGFTRVMTTYIALETGKGNFYEAVMIGIALLFISFTVNSIIYSLHGVKKK